MLQGENLTLTYQDGENTIDAVHDVSITVEDHQFIGLLGPSGSGKSSLLYLLSGLRKATQGEIYLDDRAYGKMPERERVALRRTEFGFVFQQRFLINYLTALENVMVAAPVQDKAHAEQARALLAGIRATQESRQRIEEVMRHTLKTESETAKDDKSNA